MSKTPVEQALSAYLYEGEQIRWQGETGQFPLLEQDAKKQILGKWIGTVVVAAAILGLYIGNNADWSVKAVGVVLLIAVLVLLSPIWERRSVLAQRYWITDRRAILMKGDRSFYYMELGAIDDFQVVQGKTRGDSLVLGSTLFDEVNRQLRWRACHPKTDAQSDDGKGDRAQGLVFFNIGDAAGAAALLQRAGAR